MFGLSVLVTYFTPRAHKENYVSYNTVKKQGEELEKWRRMDQEGRN